MSPTGHISASSSQDDGVRTWKRRRRFLHAGQALMIVGAVIAIVHWLTHLEAFGPGQPAGWLDLAAGYPMGAAFIFAGAILAGKK